MGRCHPGPMTIGEVTVTSQGFSRLANSERPNSTKEEIDCPRHVVRRRSDKRIGPLICGRDQGPSCHPKSPCSNGAIDIRLDGSLMKEGIEPLTGGSWPMTCTFCAGFWKGAGRCLIALLSKTRGGVWAWPWRLATSRDFAKGLMAACCPQTRLLNWP